MKKRIVKFESGKWGAQYKRWYHPTWQFLGEYPHPEASFLIRTYKNAAHVKKDLEEFQHRDEAFNIVYKKELTE